MEEFTIGHKMAAAAAAAAALIRFLLCPLCVALICVSLSLSLATNKTKQNEIVSKNSKNVRES